MSRKGDWMQTASGGQFWPLDPQPEDISIEDIAHALSMICRFGGHCLRFYSVAEHSVLLARIAEPRDRLWALLHDAPEAYILDMVRPLKNYMPGYAEHEARIERAVAWRFGLFFGIPESVKQLDLRILTDERQQNMAPAPQPWSTDTEPLGVELQFWAPDRAKREFLAEYEKIRRVP